MSVSSRRALFATAWVVALLAIFLSCTEKNSSTEPEPDPACGIAPDTLNFGTVAIGNTAERSFTLTNTGGGTLAGEISSPCAAFSVVTGGGSYALGAGQARMVKIRFRPATTGLATCSIATGSACGAVYCRATGGDAPPSCEVDPTALDFGNVPLGQTVARTFTIRNAGGGVLSGSVTVACLDFRLQDDSHSYLLAAGESDTVTILFGPTGCGERNCAVSTGSTNCHVDCVGTSEDPGCSLSTAALDFGTVAVGASVDRSFRITNEGCDVLSGTIALDCPAFEIVAGGGAFELTRGQSRSVTVRFRPSGCDSAECVVGTGLPSCGSVACRGAGSGRSCAIAPEEVDFDSVVVGSQADRGFTIRNTGCEPISGTVGTGCGDFATTAGAGAYTLAPRESLEVMIRFRPTECGERSCAVDLGSDACGEIACSGIGTSALCVVEPSSIDFGVIPLGGIADRSVTIRNTGCETISGRFVETCPDYAIRSGGGAYFLSPGASRAVTIRFAPLSAGTRACSIETGSASCARIECTGVGGSADCMLDPSSLDFGAVPEGESKDLTLRITNGGAQELDGTIPTLCGDFEVIQGGGAYLIPPGDSRDVTVRFHAVGCGPKSCMLDLGNSVCGSVGCSGTSGGAVCTIAPDSIDFGSLHVGQTVERTFTITNGGCETLTGAITEACDSFELVSGGDDFELPPGGVRTVKVRFRPIDCVPRRCSVLTGSDACGPVVCKGSGIAAFCEVTPDTIDFGPVPIGETADRSFTIRNTGCEPLDGTVGESCPEFTILSGAGTYTLAPGASRMVTMRFVPTGCGEEACNVSTGASECPSVTCVGLGGGVGCLLDPAALDFGHLAVGQTRDRSFQIQNTGCDPITGSVTESCDAFTIVSGGGDYTLAPGTSRAVTVRFAPADCGTKTCPVQTGLIACPSVACTGASDVPGCSLDPASLDFGTVLIGSSVDRTFSIANNACGVLAGEVSVGCAEYSIVAGGGAFQIPSGQSRLVTVRFAPTTCGSRQCTVATGAASCGDVSCTGSGGGSLCTVVPTTLDFGTVAQGGSADRSFTISNDGCESISGTVSEECAEYSITSGGGAYSLSPGAERIVGVRFSPTGCGVSDCAITTGSSGCANVAATGIGGGAVCTVAPTALDFDAVPVGESATRDFAITNDGCTELSGTVAASCVDYSITAGGGAYSLVPGASRTVTVRFAPTACGARPCTITTGEGCSEVEATGTGSGTVCTVAPTSLDFGTIAVGDSDTRDFAITNDGCTALNGTVSASCADYSITAGGGAYSLAPGASRTVTVRFAPTVCGVHLCTIATGAGCSDVEATGLGGDTVCAVTPASLDFGTIHVGESADRSFTIRNDGCLALQGSVAESCPDFVVVSGGGAYDLAAGDSVAVTVRFQPGTVGEKSCTVATGHASCTDVACAGRACPVSPVTLSALQDATIRSGLPDQISCTEPFLYVGVDTLSSGQEWALLAFDLREIPSDAIVTGVTLEVYVDGCDPPPDGGTVPSDLMSLDADWDECTVTWNNAPGAASVPCALELACANTGFRAYDCETLVAIVQGWVVSSSTNHGFSIRPTSSGHGAVTLRSRGAGELPPRLKVWFNCP